MTTTSIRAIALPQPRRFVVGRQELRLAVAASIASAAAYAVFTYGPYAIGVLLLVSFP